jgi:predicted ATPase
MAYPDAWIYEFTTEGVARVSYEETEHFQDMRSFLANPARMLRTLLDNDE